MGEGFQKSNWGLPKKCNSWIYPKKQKSVGIWYRHILGTTNVVLTKEVPKPKVCRSGIFDWPPLYRDVWCKWGCRDYISGFHWNYFPLPTIRIQNSYITKVVTVSWYHCICVTYQLIPLVFLPISNSYIRSVKPKKAAKTKAKGKAKA